MTKYKTKVFTEKNTCYSKMKIGKVSFMKKATVSIKEIFESELNESDKLFAISILLKDKINPDELLKLFGLRIKNVSLFHALRNCYLRDPETIKQNLIKNY